MEIKGSEPLQQNSANEIYPTLENRIHFIHLQRKISFTIILESITSSFKCLIPRSVFSPSFMQLLTLILRRSRTGTVWFYTSTSNKRAARPKLYTESLTRDLKRMYRRFTLVRIYINL